MKITRIIGLGIAGLATASASADLVPLTEDVQGKGNMGTSFRPVTVGGLPADFVLTARSMIDDSMMFDPFAPGSVGTIYIDRDDRGAGVQTLSTSGSKGISGGGGHKDEEILVSFDAPALASTIELEINELEFGNGAGDKDDPVLFVALASGGSPLVFMEDAIMDAFTFSSSKRGILDLGAILGLDPAAGVLSVAVRETNGHIYLSGVSGSPIPAPGALAVVGMGLGVVARRRRHA